MNSWIMEHVLDFKHCADHVVYKKGESSFIYFVYYWRHWQWSNYRCVIRWSHFDAVGILGLIIRFCKKIVLPKNFSKLNPLQLSKLIWCSPEQSLGPYQMKPPGPSGHAGLYGSSEQYRSFGLSKPPFPQSLRPFGPFWPSRHYMIFWTLQGFRNILTLWTPLTFLACVTFRIFLTK